MSGWRYPPWRGVFYPENLVQRRELEFASRAFRTIEINGSFYSLQRPESYAEWHRQTPEGFVFSVKGGRYITHLLRLKEIEKPLANFFASGLFNLREKLGPFLWQFPPFFRFEAERFEHFLQLLPRDAEQAPNLARRHHERMNGRVQLTIDSNYPLRHAVEIRHESFADESFIAMLRRHAVALVVADTAGKWPYCEDVTSDFLYLRLHGDKEIYASGYTEEAHDRWAARIRPWSGETSRTTHAVFPPSLPAVARVAMSTVISTTTSRSGLRTTHGGLKKCLASLLQRHLRCRLGATRLNVRIGATRFADGVSDEAVGTRRPALSKRPKSGDLQWRARHRPAEDDAECRRRLNDPCSVNAQRRLRPTISVCARD